MLLQAFKIELSEDCTGIKRPVWVEKNNQRRGSGAAEVEKKEFSLDLIPPVNLFTLVRKLLSNICNFAYIPTGKNAFRDL